MPIRPSPLLFDGATARDIEEPGNTGIGLHQGHYAKSVERVVAPATPPGSGQAQVQAITQLKPPPKTLNSSAISPSPVSPPTPGTSSLPASPESLPAQAEASAESSPAAKADAVSNGPKQGIITVGGIDFHHPSEAEFARLLNYYGIEWEYEPHQFPLQWRDGRPTEMFRPDFYLTEYDLYFELTTMRQALVRRKNRKLRLLRALYPEISIKLLYRRDYQRLLERFGIKPDELLAESPQSDLSDAAGDALEGAQ